jgi:hypothetical protein
MRSRGAGTSFVLVLLAGAPSSAPGQSQPVAPAGDAQAGAPKRLGRSAPVVDAGQPGAAERRPPTTSSPDAADPSASQRLGKKYPAPVPLEPPPPPDEPDVHVSVVSPSESTVHRRVGRRGAQRRSGPGGGRAAEFEEESRDAQVSQPMR